VIFTPVAKPGEIKDQAKIEEVDKKFSSLVMGKDASGRSVIKQLQLAGKRIRIIFE
jgi:hypothetical protein